MDIEQSRRLIDQIDDKIMALFCERMHVAQEIAAYKKANNLPIHVPSREEEILLKVAEKADPEFLEYTQALFQTIFALSRQYQQKKM